MKTSALAGMAGITLVASLAPAAAQEPAPVEEKPAMGRELLLEKAVTLPSSNVKASILRVTFPPGFRTPWHTHKGPGPRYILKGTLKVVEGGKPNTYSAGDVFWESGGVMSVENIGEGEAQLVIFELAPSAE